jgi:SAM-dependent methyltransferase
MTTGGTTYSSIVFLRPCLMPSPGERSQHSLSNARFYAVAIIGDGYARTRREDPRLKQRIVAALADARTVVNVGAGSGSYEPGDRLVVAVEPSAVMVAQRPQDRAGAVRATADMLPLREQGVDAAMAVLTIHHWDDELDDGLSELLRVARETILIVTFDPAVSSRMWLVEDYLPEVGNLDINTFPDVGWLVDRLGGEVETVPIASDTPDWTLGSFWAHPERVLDETARNATSGFSRMDPAVVQRVVSDVQRDLDDGTWDRRHGHLRNETEYDAGLRLVIARR